jgi:uncharacterized Zn ribbon protein
MAKKTFGELKGIQLEIQDKNSGEKTTASFVSDNKEEKGKSSLTYSLIYNGDPLFMVDTETMSIKNCVVKFIKGRYNSTVTTIGFCEKNKATSYIPTRSDVLYSGHSNKEIKMVSLPSSRSKHGVFATNLADALEILNRLKTKRTFSTTKVGDSVFLVSRESNSVKEIKVTRVDKTIGYYDYSFCNGLKLDFDDRTYAYIGQSKFDTKTSTYSDMSFEIRVRGRICDERKYFLYTDKEEAEKALDSMIRKYEAAKKKEKKETPLGSEIKLKDSKGNTLHIGDTVAYVRSCGQSSLIGTGVIIKETKVQIQVFDEEERESKRAERRERQRRNNWDNYTIEYDDDGLHYLSTSKLLLVKQYKK